MGNVDTNTKTVMVCAPGRAEEVEITEGTTLAQLTEKLGIAGAASMTALDEVQNKIEPDDVIGPEVEAVSLIVNVTGAVR